MDNSSAYDVASMSMVAPVPIKAARPYTATPSLLDSILLLGVVLSPLTSLRIWKIGPSEIMLFAWSMITLLKQRRIAFGSPFVRFWMIYWLAYAAGWLASMACELRAPANLSGLGSMAFFTLFTVALSSWFCRIESSRVGDHLYAASKWAVCGYALIFWYGRYVSRTLLGVSLWHSAARYSGGALNPHQYATAAGPLLLVFLGLMSRRTMSAWHRFACWIAATLTFFSTIETRSSTLYATYTSLALLAIYLIICRHRNRLLATSLAILLSILAIAFLAVQYNSVVTFVTDFVLNDANGLGRFEIWGSGLNLIPVSPFVGLGPAGYVALAGGAVESHNTYIQVMLNVGLAGFVAFAYLMVLLARRLRHDPYMFAALAFFCVYGIAGYVLRRPAFWFILVGAFYYVSGYGVRRETSRP